MIFTDEQKERLVQAYKACQKSKRKVDDAQKELQEKNEILKTCSGCSGVGQMLYDDVQIILGQFYLDQIDKD